MRRLFLRILAWKLKILAKITLKKYRPGIIGITGNVGKTSAKEAMRSVLSQIRRVRAGSKNFNNEFGLPLVILGDWDLTEGLFFWFKVVWNAVKNLILTDNDYPEVLILEYGIDRPGDMNYLLSIVRPSIGVVTAVGEIPVHVEFFAGPEGVAREKEKLVNQLPATGFAILNADDEAVLEMKNQTRAHVVTFGFSEDADMRITNFGEHIEDGSGGVNFKLNYGGSFIPVRLNGVFGKTQGYAAAAAAITGLIFGANLVKISEALAAYESPAGRLKVIRGIKQSTIIDDTYNASPAAMHEALDVLRRLKAKRKIAVLGDMLEIGKYTMQAHEEIGRIAAKSASILITVGLRAKFYAEGAMKANMRKSSIFVFDKLAEAALFLQNKIQRGDLVLIKGSQSVRMEKVVEEVMAEPEKARELLVRQTPAWKRRKGLYG